MRIREAALEKPLEKQKIVMVRSNKPEVIRAVRAEKEFTQDEQDYLRYVGGTDS